MASNDSTRRFNGRECAVKSIAPGDAISFLEANHRQGASVFPAVVTCLGLFHGEELLAVTAFCAPRTEAMKRRYTTELLRMAFKKNVRVMGGASKLMSAYRRTFKPADIFTYQDASGELTSVYEASGFTFVSQARRKDYLVAPGKTLKTANRKEALGMAYAVRYGPDRILGTKLGEVPNGAGGRLSNREIFTEKLGWHVESTAGDRIYEWIDPDRTYYTYRISASDSKKYYYGVSHLKKANASEEDCVAHEYYGSGGAGPNNKFRNWRKRHTSTLVKEVLGRYARRANAYEAEKSLVGDLHRTDEYCLNSTSGGKDGGLRGDKLVSSFAILSCPTHGMSKHQGSHCCRCLALINTTLQECSRHGITKHRGEQCCRCSVSKQFSKNDCAVHGLTNHRGSLCCRCVASATYSRAHCSTHGRSTLHRYGTCVSCEASKHVSMGTCATHGEVKFRGSTCISCLIASQFTLKDCAEHGEATHQGSTCLACVSARRVQLKNCDTHGLVKHNGSTCSTCSTQAALKLLTCTLHGEVLHQGTVCTHCTAASAYSDELCLVHGRTRHQGGQCKKCESAGTVSMANCATHGETKHRGGKCCRCATTSSIALRHCVTHGLVKHRGESCYSCRAATTAATKRKARA